MAAQRQDNDNPFMAVALAPMEKAMSAPDMSKPMTREEQAVINKHRVDMYKEASKIEEAMIAIEGINIVNERAVARFQEGQNFMAELEQATAQEKRATVEQYNRALATAAGNGTIQVMKHLVTRLNAIVDDDEPFKPLPAPVVQTAPTVEHVQVGFRDALRGHVTVSKNR